MSSVRRQCQCSATSSECHVRPLAFSMWGIDVIGAIEPKASNGHRFILVAIDYFTKWVKAASYTNVTSSVVVKFIKRELICLYRLPRKIITDNGTNLNNKMMQEMCACHTLISSGDLCLMTCDFCLVLVRCFAPIIRQFVKFQDVPENKRKY